MAKKNKKRAHTEGRLGIVRRSARAYTATLEGQLSQLNLPKEQRAGIEANIAYAKRSQRIPPRGRGLDDEKRGIAIHWFGWRS